MKPPILVFGRLAAHTAFERSPYLGRQLVRGSLQGLDYCPRQRPHVVSWLAYWAHCCGHSAPPDPTVCGVQSSGRLWPCCTCWSHSSLTGSVPGGPADPGTEGLQHWLRTVVLFTGDLDCDGLITCGWNQSFTSSLYGEKVPAL